MIPTITMHKILTITRLAVRRLAGCGACPGLYSTCLAPALSSLAYPPPPSSAAAPSPLSAALSSFISEKGVGGNCGATPPFPRITPNPSHTGAGHSDTRKLGSNPRSQRRAECGHAVMSGYGYVSVLFMRLCIALSGARLMSRALGTFPDHYKWAA